MKGEWAYEKDKDTWHLIVPRPGAATGPQKSEVGVYTWCGKKLDLESHQKAGVSLNGMADILHDECVRRSESL